MSDAPTSSLPPIHPPVNALNAPPIPAPHAGSTASPRYREPPAAQPSPSPAPTPVDTTPAAGREGASVDAADLESASQPMYVTRQADSFWNISKQAYGGQGRYFKALYHHNRDRILRPDQIPAGIEIETPPLAELQRLYPDLCQLGQRR